jgi:predicted NAD/FAD-dependent oxidoreductase
MSAATPRIALVGTGMAGAACARDLANAGLDVTLFEKSRGVGGRLATRRAEWAVGDSLPQPARFDHGAPGFGVHSADFQQFVDRAQRDGLLAPWTPRLAPRSHQPLEPSTLWVPKRDMPSLCRALLAGLSVRTECTVDGLHRSGHGWALDSGGTRLGDGFAAVIVATPPIQAAALVQPVRPDWAAQAQAIEMRPCWTLMAVTRGTVSDAEWDLSWSPHPMLATVLRDDRKPGREFRPGVAHWVVHADAEWSRTHLESPPAQVLARMQAALADWMGHVPRWHHAAVHRWRYASAPRTAAGLHPCWWDADSGLGVAGDALGGGGVEGAWRSGTELARRVVAGFADRAAA